MDILHNDDIHALYHLDGNCGISGSYCSCAVSIPGKGKGNRFCNCFVVCRSCCLLQIVDTRCECSNQYIVVGNRCQLANFRTVLILGDGLALFVAVYIELRAGKAVFVLIHLAQLHFITLGVIGEGYVVLTVRNDFAVHRIAGSPLFAVLQLSVNDDLLLDLYQFVTFLCGLGDRIGRSRGNVGNTDSIAVGDLQCSISRLATVADRHNIAIVLKAVAIRITGDRCGNIVAVRIVVVITVHAVPRDLVAAERRGIVGQCNCEFEFLIRIDLLAHPVDRLCYDFFQVDAATKRVIDTDTIVHLLGICDGKRISAHRERHVHQRSVHQHRMIHHGLHIEVVGSQIGFFYFVGMTLLKKIVSRAVICAGRIFRFVQPTSVHHIFAKHDAGCKCKVLLPHRAKPERVPVIRDGDQLSFSLRPVICIAIPAQSHRLVILTVLLNGKGNGFFLRIACPGIIQEAGQLDHLQLGVPLLGEFSPGARQPHGSRHGKMDRFTFGVGRFGRTIFVLFVLVNVIIQILVGIRQRRIRPTGILHDIRHTSNTVSIIQNSGSV